MDVIKLFQGGFPATIETLSFLQDAYTKPLKALTALAGNNVILSGMNWNVGTSKFLEGWYISEDGEPVYFKESSIGDNDTIGVIEKTIQVPYNVDNDSDGNLDLKDAYVTKFATMNFSALESDEVLIETFSRTLLTPIGNFKTALMPVGACILWFDLNNIPAGFRVCDGSDGSPDMLNSFVKGHGSEGTVGQKYGAREKTLSASNLPPHSHSIPSQNFTKRFGTGGARSDGGDDYLRTNDSDGTGSTKSFTTTATNTGNGSGSSTPLNIEPLHIVAVWIQYTGL